MVRKLFLYLRYVLEADTKESRQAGSRAAREWCLKRHGTHITDAYRRDFSAFTGAYQREYCHKIAKQRLAQLSKD